MKRKRFLGVIISTAMILSLLAGCGSYQSNPNTGQTSVTENGSKTSSENSQEKSENTSINKNVNTNLTQADNVDPGTVNIAINSTVTSYGPFVVAQNGYNFVKNYVYETLGEFGSGGTEFQGILAKSWTQTDEDGFEFDVEIYDNITDSKGNSITADDVVWSYQTVMETGTNNMVSAATVTSLEAVGENTVHFVLAKNTIGALESVLRGVNIVSRKEYESSADEMASNPVGTGHYVVTDFVSDSSISVTKREDYWQKEESLIADVSRANVTTIQIQEITETSQMAIALQTGTIDVAVGINAISTEMFLNNQDYTVFSTPSKLGMQLYFSGDSHSALSTSKELRQAVSYAINIDAIIAAVYGGYGKPQYVFGTDQVPDFQESWYGEDYYSYDLNKAKELLSAAGYKEGELTLSLLTVNDDTYVKYAEIIQSNLLAAGIRVEINAVEGALYMSSFQDSKQYDMVLNNVTGNYITNIWANKLGQEYYNGTTMSGFTDDTLQGLLDTCNSIDGHTPENIDKCWQYIKDSNYVYSMAAPEAFTVVSSKIKVGNPMYDGLSNFVVAGTVYTE